MHQFQLYAYIYWIEKILKLAILGSGLFEMELKWSKKSIQMEIQKTMEWFEETIEQIKNEEEWMPNISSKNKYFCSQICSFRHFCPYNT